MGLQQDDLGRLRLTLDILPGILFACVHILLVSCLQWFLVGATLPDHLFQLGLKVPMLYSECHYHLVLQLLLSLE